MLKRAYSQAKDFFNLTLFERIVQMHIHIYGTESKLPTYLQISSILSISFNSVLAVEVWFCCLLNYFSHDVL